MNVHKKIKVEDSLSSDKILDKTDSQNDSNSNPGSSPYLDNQIEQDKVSGFKLKVKPLKLKLFGRKSLTGEKKKQLNFDSVGIFLFSKYFSKCIFNINYQQDFSSFSYFLYM